MGAIIESAGEPDLPVGITFQQVRRSFAPSPALTTGLGPRFDLNHI
jgi:hypothetical protein